MNLNDKQLLAAEYHRYEAECRYALRLAEARARNLEDYLESSSGRDIIKTISTRVKTFDSAFNKCLRKGMKEDEITMEAIRSRIHDAAGLRIVTFFRSDIYTVADMLERQPGFNLVEKIDYIENPKENGYESLHYLFTVETYVDRSRIQTIEVQVRSLGMDMWSIYDHHINYKKAEGPSLEALEIFKNMSHQIDKFEAFSEKLTVIEPKATVSKPAIPVAKPAAPAAKPVASKPPTSKPAKKS